MAGTTGRFFPIVGVSLGTASSFSTFNESALNASGSGPWAGQLGSVFEQNGNCYRLVQFDNGSGDVASTVGGVAHWKTRASYIVTSDQTDAQASLNSVAGAFLKAGLTDQYYCFIQMGGSQAVTTDTTCAAGTALIASTADLALSATTTNTKGNQLIYAVSYGTNSTTSANVYWVFGNLL